MQKPILVFPYHDPKAVFVESLLRNIPLLKKHFSEVFVSVTPVTAKTQGETIEMLDREGFHIVRNERDGDVAEHHNAGVRAATEGRKEDEYICYGHIDRILFSLETQHKETFLEDISKDILEDIVLFSRSEFAWSTHPKDYCILEHAVTEIGSVFIGQKIDWAWCCALFRATLAAEIAKKSVCNDFSILAEYLLLAFASGASFRNVRVDWLEWEDPHWYAEKNAKNDILEEEKRFRLSYCLSAAKLFLDMPVLKKPSAFGGQNFLSNGGASVECAHEYYIFPGLQIYLPIYSSTYLLISISMQKIFSQEVSLVFGGEAGQGVQTIEEMCATVLFASGYHVFSVGEYMSRVRGGSNSTEIRVSETKKQAFVERIDMVFPFGCSDMEHVRDRISPETVIIGDEDQLRNCETKGLIAVPFLKTAEEVGGKIFANVVMSSFVLSFFDVPVGALEQYLRKKFERKGEEIVAKNILAVEKGWSLGKAVQESHGIKMDIAKRTVREGERLLKGEKAIALGAVAGGCDFISSYPMSPSTGVFAGIAELSKDFAIVVEQVEDEISAANMAFGAWYAGARAMTSTSGGGFDLMTEAVSLGGMIESPMVFHIAQRPGPSTGLPTQTEQGDLNCVLYAGHGEFPRIILAPGTLEDGVTLAKKAFDLADKFQVSVFVMTDQFFMDTQTGVDTEKISMDKYQKYFVETGEKYKRYALTGDGLSPRGIPGFGKGMVCVDSDEHEEDGHITESHETRVAMVDKRMARTEMIREEAIPAELVGSEKYSTLIIGWGSTYGVIREAFEIAKKPMTSFLHVKQVYPLGADVFDFVARADRVVVIENNITGQFADLLSKETGRKVDDRVLQYDGTPFSVERLIEEIKNLNGRPTTNDGEKEAGSLKLPACR